MEPFPPACGNARARRSVPSRHCCSASGRIRRFRSRFSSRLHSVRSCRRLGADASAGCTGCSWTAPVSPAHRAPAASACGTSTSSVLVQPSSPISTFAWACESIRLPAPAGSRPAGGCATALRSPRSDTGPHSGGPQSLPTIRKASQQSSDFSPSMRGPENAKSTHSLHAQHERRNPFQTERNPYNAVSSPAAGRGGGHAGLPSSPAGRFRHGRTRRRCTETRMQKKPLPATTKRG